MSEVVRRIHAADPEGSEQLYRFCRMLSANLRRQFGYQDYEDRLHDVYLIVIEAIRSGKVRCPEALFGYISGVARHVMCAQATTRTRRSRLTPAVQHWVANRWSEEESPEERLWRRERVDILRRALAGLGARDREILTRFYIHEQTKEQICAEMQLTQTQFRLAKSRAKARLAGAGLQQGEPARSAA